MRIHTHAGVPHELIEWHGHNDFYKAVVQFYHSMAVWLLRCQLPLCLVSVSVPVIHLWKQWYLNMHS